MVKWRTQLHHRHHQYAIDIFRAADYHRGVIPLFDDDESGKAEVEPPKSTNFEGIVFHERYLGLKESEQRKMRILNKHLLPSNTVTEGEFEIPKVKPYTGLIPEVFIPYSASVCYNSQYKGIYCHIDDAGFSTSWTRPVDGLRKVQQFMVATAPDHTLWMDALRCENIEQIRKTRTTQLFWQNNGVDTIQTASWGDADSIMTYAFDGLAEGSWTSIGHQRVGNKIEQRLFRFGVKTLVERKHPLGLIVFGAPLDFDPGVTVIVKPSFISKLRNL
jgi:hypothetical protein